MNKNPHKSFREFYPNMIFDFTVFSFLGWIIETIFVFYCVAKWTVRGNLLYGSPMIFIYGIGGLCIIYSLQPFRKKPFQLFLVSMLILTSLELAASYFEEFVLHMETWNYADNFLNFQGRICLTNSLGWGAIGVFLEYAIYPNVEKIRSKIKVEIMNFLGVVLSIYIAILFLVTYVFPHVTQK